jgi:GGDEF domain-containing protein
MPEASINIPLPKEELPIEACADSKAAELVEKYLEEPTVEQEGFLSREDWQAALEEQLRQAKNGTLVVMIDIVGGTEQSEQGTMADKKAELVSQIRQLQQGVILTSVGRITVEQAEINEPGSDEFLFFLEIDSAKQAAEYIQQIQKIFNADHSLNQVHLGASFMSAGLNSQTFKILRGADYALGQAKEANKDPENEAAQGNPKLLTFEQDEDGELAGKIEDELVKPEHLQQSEVNYGDRVITRNSVEALRIIRQEADANESVWLIFTPKEMKKINEKKGMRGGDQVLQSFSEVLLAMTNGQVYKIGTNFVIPHFIEPTQLNDFYHQLDSAALYGFNWSHLYLAETSEPEETASEETIPEETV